MKVRLVPNVIFSALSFAGCRSTESIEPLLYFESIHSEAPESTASLAEKKMVFCQSLSGIGPIVWKGRATLQDHLAEFGGHTDGRFGIVNLRIERELRVYFLMPIPVPMIFGQECFAISGSVAQPGAEGEP